MVLLASRRTRILAGAVAVGLLAVGFAVKPAAPVVAPPTEEPAPILQQVVEQRQADAVFRRMRDAAPLAVRFAAQLTPLDVRPDTWSDWQAIDDERRGADRFGIVTGSRFVLGDVADLDPGSRVRVTLGDGRAFEGSVTSRFTTRGLAVIELATDATLQAPPIVRGEITAGTAAFATAPRTGTPIVAPLFVAAVTRRELLTTNALDPFRGMPVFTLDGELAGIVAVEDGRARVLTVEAAMAPVPAEPPPEARFGLTIAVQRGSDGNAVTVTNVAPAGAAARAGVLKGDILISVNGVRVADLEDAIAELSTADAVVLTVRRGTRLRTIRMAPARDTSR